MFWSDLLLEAWDARPADDKFQLVCMAHNADDFSRWQQYLTAWTARRAVRILFISGALDFFCPRPSFVLK